MLAYVLKYLGGSIFTNAYTSSAGETIGKLSTIPLLRYISLKKVALIAFGMGSLGTFLLILAGDNQTLVPWALIVARLGFS